MRPACRLAVRLVLGLALTAPAVAGLAALPAASKLTPKDNALYIVRSGIKSADFVARGMAYRGLAMDKGNKELKKILEDGMSDPQWTVRRGVAEAMYAIHDDRWKQLVHDALALPVLSPYDVLPVLDDFAQKDVFALLIATLADKEISQQDTIVKGLVGRNRPDLGDFLKIALTSKEPLVVQSALKGVAQLDAVLHAKALEIVAKGAPANDELAKILADLAAAADDRIETPFLAVLKPKDAALQNRIVLLRAAHGDKAVGKALLAIAQKTQGKEQIQALVAYRKVADKNDAPALKALLSSATSELVYQVYEILARMGDRSMAGEAQKLAESTDVDVRAPGVFYLGWVGGAGRLGEMHGYLRDGVPAVRIAAARVLGYIGSSVSVGPIKEAIDGEHDDRVRVELIRALTGIHDKEGYQALVFYTREKETEVRRLVVKALAESGDAQARQGLQNALNDNDPHIRFEAVRGFLLSDPAEAVKVWRRALRWLPRGALLDLTREMTKTMEGFLEIAVFEASRDDQGLAVREEALLALHQLPEAEVRVLHKVMSTSDDQDLRVRVLSQLFLLEGKKVATEIKTAALGQQVRARVAAIRMLGKLKGDKEAAELLLRFLDEADERVRIAASLTFLGG